MAIQMAPYSHKCDECSISSMCDMSHILDINNQPLCDKNRILADCMSDVEYTDEAKTMLEKLVFLMSEDKYKLENYLGKIALQLNSEINKKEGKDENIKTKFVEIKIEIGKKLYELKEDVQIAGIQAWPVFLKNAFPGLLARTIDNYIRLASANIDKKYYYMGIFDLIKIETASRAAKVTFNEFVEKGLSQNDLDLRKNNADEWSRFISKRAGYVRNLKIMETNGLILGLQEQDAFKIASDNGFCPSKNDITDFKEKQKNNVDLAPIFTKRILKSQPNNQSGIRTLTAEAQLANSREDISAILSSLQNTPAVELSAINKDLLEDFLEKINSIGSILTTAIQAQTAAPPVVVETPEEEPNKC